MKLSFQLIMRFLLIIFFIISIISLNSCTSTENDCHENKEVNMRISFIKKTVSDLNVISFSTLTIDSVTAKGLGNDSILYNNKKKLTYLKLPLNKFETQSDFIIKFNEITDTLSVFYQNNSSYYLSFECGCIVIHQIDEVISTNHFIDSVSIINRDVNTTDAENIKIFN